MTSYLVYSTVALEWNRKIQCRNSCRRMSFPLYLVWERHSTPLFQQCTPACEQQFLDKSSTQHGIRCIFIDQYFAVSVNFFSTYCTVILKLRYRDIVSFRTKKIAWVKIWSLINCKFHVSRCDVENIVWSFSMPLWCNKHLPGQGPNIIIAFEFFGMFVSTSTPNVFGGGGKVVLVFEIQ